MSDQLILAWTVGVAGSSFGPAAAAAKLSGVELYKDDTTDPVLGQLFGLTVADDETTSDATSATRTLTLNMTSSGGSPTAPPPFPCHPITSTPPVLPYPLRTTKTLPGEFFVENGVMVIHASATQIPSLNVGDVIQFLSQQGVFYTVTASGATSISITPAYSGVSGETTAFKEVAAPCPLNRAAVYSSSDLDTDGVATTPAIPSGSGARTVELIYLDSTGAGPFVAEAELTGRRPAPFEFDESHGEDIAVIVNMLIDDSGDFENNVGEITLVELSDALPEIPANATPGTGIGAAQGDRTFFALTDEAQLLITRHLAYLPPSFFALAQQQQSKPQLDGDFLVTTDSVEVFTTVDQTAVLSAGNTIEFADQIGTIYTIAAVTPKLVKLTTIYTGIDTNNTGLMNTPNNNFSQTKGNLGDAVIKKATGATLLAPSPALPPSDAFLSGPLGQFVALEVAAPPPSPPLPPGTVPVPVFLSGLFKNTLQLALAGVPITSATIAFA